MSFILDALRKSEHERRMETAPDIMHSPVAVARQPLPTWAIVLIASLGAALIAVSIYTVAERMADSAAEPVTPSALSAPPREAATPPAPTAPPAIVETTEAAAPVAAPPSVTPAASPVTATRPAQATAAAVIPNPVNPGPANTSGVDDVQADTTATAARIPAAAPQPAAAPSAPEPAFDPGQLPPYAAILAEGLNVGALQMQLHVHSTSPASRFVVVNGARRREGDRLAEGPIIEEIVPEGAVLRFEGRRFLLTPN